MSIPTAAARLRQRERTMLALYRFPSAAVSLGDRAAPVPGRGDPRTLVAQGDSVIGATEREESLPWPTFTVGYEGRMLEPGDEVELTGPVDFPNGVALHAMSP
jgi:hypothetical protein